MLLHFLRNEEYRKYRFATEADVGLILQFIQELADYEKMLPEVIATEGLLREWIFEKQKADVIFALSLGAEHMKDWTVYRITGQTLTNLAQ